MNDNMARIDDYVIVTSARNAAATLRLTADSVVAQTVLPRRWVIVSDGSTDETDHIARQLAADHSWVLYARRVKSHEENRRVELASPGKARAIALAWGMVTDVDFEFFSNLDDDIELPSFYYEKLLAKMRDEPRLGIAGGTIRNVFFDGAAAPGGFFKRDFVGGAVQTFRRECFEHIGGYRPYGHEDGIAVGCAKKRGWQVCSYNDLEVVHRVSRETYATTIRAKVPVCYYLGRMQYVSREPAWKVMARSAKRAFSRPLILAGCSMLVGYISGLTGRPPKIPRDLEQDRLI